MNGGQKLNRSMEGRRAPAYGEPVMLTKAEMAYWRIRGEIMDGTLPPGAGIDQEALASRLGLSTTPVREALRCLESERLVIGRAHRDTVVAGLSRQLVEDTYVVRLNLDPLAASLAAKFARPEELAEIVELARAETSDDPAEQLHRNRALHRAIYCACANEVLIEILDPLWDRIDRYRLITMKEQRDAARLREEHIEIADAVAARDGRLAAKLMKAHITGARERVRKTLRSTAPDPEACSAAATPGRLHG